MPKKKAASHRYFIGTEAHKRMDMMTEVNEETYREHYLVSETYLLSVHEANKLPRGVKREALLKSLQELADFTNGMMIGEVK